MTTKYLSCNPQIIDLEADTGTEYELSFDNVLNGFNGERFLVAISMITGEVRFNSMAAITNDAAELTEGEKEIIEVIRGRTLRFKGPDSGENSYKFRVSVITTQGICH